MDRSYRSPDFSFRDPMFWFALVSVAIAFLIPACPTTADAAPAKFPGRSDCVGAGLQGLTLAVDGQCNWSRISVRGCLAGNLDSPPPGSGNWPIMLEAALAMCGEQLAVERLLPMIRGEGRWGHGGRESGSLVYEGWVTASLMVLRKRAIEAGRLDLAEQIGIWLRAEWGFLALHRVPSGTPLRGWIGGIEGHRSTLRGAWVNPTGDRSVIGRDPSRHLIPDRSSLSVLLRWCLGKEPSSGWQLNARRWEWPQALLRRSAGHGGERQLGEEYCALQASDVQLLRQPMVRKGKPSAGLRRAAELLAPFRHPGRPKSGRQRSLAGWSDGSWISSLSGTANANKPGVAYSWFDARKGEAGAVVPSPFRGVGAKSAFSAAHWSDQTVAAWSNSGWRSTYEMPGTGPPVWTLTWSGDGVDLLFDGEQQIDGGDPPSVEVPIPAPAPPPPTGTELNRARRQYRRLVAQVETSVQQAEILLRDLKQVQAYLDRAGRDFGLRKEKKR